MADKPALLPAYLIVGPDELKRKQALARLRARVDGPFSAFNLEEIVAGGDTDVVSTWSRSWPRSTRCPWAATGASW